MNKTALFSLIGSILISLTILAGFPVHAQSVSLTLKPAVYEFLIQPGKTIILQYQLSNLDDPVNGLITVKPLAPAASTGDLQIASETGANIAIIGDSRLPFEKPVILTKGETITFQITLQLADQVKEKDYYYGVIFQTQPQPAREGTATINVRAATTSLLVLHVTRTGDLEKNIHLASVDIKSNFKLKLLGKNYAVVDVFAPIPLVLTVQNAGKNAGPVHGAVELSTWFRQKQSYAISSETIYADSQKTLNLIIPPRLPGLYRIDARLVGGKTGSVEQSTVSVLVLPLKLLIFLSAGFVIGLAVFFYFLHTN